jgi:uncharacterized membrane protein YjjB (DUF3815 family)
MIIRILFAGFASSAFAILFKTKFKFLPLCSINGALCWFIYEIFSNNISFESGIIFASMSVGFVSYVFSKIIKINKKMFVTSGIIPLVPGATAFFALQSFLEGLHNQAFTFMYQTFFSSFGIVIGLTISVNLTKYIDSGK